MREPMGKDEVCVWAMVISVMMIGALWTPHNWIDGLIELGVCIGISWGAYKVQEMQLETYWRWRDEQERMK